MLGQRVTTQPRQGSTVGRQDRDEQGKSGSDEDSGSRPKDPDRI